MAPYSRSTTSPQTESWALLSSPEHFFKILLFVSILVAAFKTTLATSLRRKKSCDTQEAIDMERSATSSQEKEDQMSHVRNESALDQAVDRQATRPSRQGESNQRLQAIEKELSTPAFNPVYPWTAPPKQLPGPYDAPYYPLPSMRRHSDVPSCDPPETQQTLPYTRRVSASNVPSQDTVLRGSTTVSNHGWRRTQWTVASG